MLLTYDILVHLFEHLRSGYREVIGLSTLASCARVCRTWQDPATLVLWRKLPSLHPLCMLLAERNLSPEAKWLSALWESIDAEKLVKEVVEQYPEKWLYFLQRASYVWEIGTEEASTPNEAALIRSLAMYNQGKPILPSLQKLTWRYAVPCDASPLLLTSSSLRELEIIVVSHLSGIASNFILIMPTAIFSPGGLDTLFDGLSEAAPFLRKFTISGRQPLGESVIPYTLRLTHLRELCLRNQSCALDPDRLSSVLENLPKLEILVTWLANFTNPVSKVSSYSLRDLHLQGSADDFSGILSRGYLDLPSLQRLTLRSTHAATFRDLQHIFELIASAGFTPSLRALGLNITDEAAIEMGWNESTSDPYSIIIEPLLALHALEDADLCLATYRIPFRDEDVHTIASAWKNITKLSLAYPPLGPQTIPSLVSLRYFAEQCPRLVHLQMTKLALPAALDVPRTRDPRALAHPLRLLDLKTTLALVDSNDGAARVEKSEVARYIDYLFPNLVLRRPSGARQSAKVKLLGTFAWESVEDDIHILREHRRVVE